MIYHVANNDHTERIPSLFETYLKIVFNCLNCIVFILEISLVLC